MRRFYAPRKRGQYLHGLQSKQKYHLVLVVRFHHPGTEGKMIIWMFVILLLFNTATLIYIWTIGETIDRIRDKLKVDDPPYSNRIK